MGEQASTQEWQTITRPPNPAKYVLPGTSLLIYVLWNKKKPPIHLIFQTFLSFVEMLVPSHGLLQGTPIPTYHTTLTSF